jgi:hypothetical protein
MTVENASPEGTTGNPVEKSAENISNDVVPRESFRQILDEKKKVQQENIAMKAKLDQLEAEQRAREEQTLIEQQNWKKLAEKHQEDAQTAKELLAGQVRRAEDEKKKHVLANELKLKDEKFWKLVDLDSVPSEPEAIKEFAAKFRKDYADVCIVSSLTPPPGTAPQSSGGTPRPMPKNENDWRAVLAEHNKAFAEKIVQGGSFNDVFKK